MEEDRIPKKDLHSRTGGDEIKGKTQERMQRRSRKRSSSDGSERWRELVIDREKMEGYSSTSQSPQWAAVPMEERKIFFKFTCSIIS